MGKQGVVELSQSLYDKAHYLANELSTVKGIKAPLFQPFFSEFVIDFGEMNHEEIESKCLEKGIIPGTRLLAKSTLRLITVTELMTKNDLDTFVQTIKEVVS